MFLFCTRVVVISQIYARRHRQEMRVVPSGLTVTERCQIVLSQDDPARRGKYRVARGGSYQLPSKALRSATRVGHMTPDEVIPICHLSGDTKIMTKKKKKTCQILSLFVQTGISKQVKVCWLVVLLNVVLRRIDNFAAIHDKIQFFLISRIRLYTISCGV